MHKEFTPSPQIIYHTAGGILQTLSSNDFIQYGSTLKNTDFDGISALPFRQENIAELYETYFPPVVLVEDAWNPGHFDNMGLAITEGIYGHMQRLTGNHTEPPILQDTLFFPSKITAQMETNMIMDRFPDAHFGAVDFTHEFPPERTFVHIQREYKSHQMTADEILHKSKDTGSLLLFDPTHLLKADMVSYPGFPTVQRTDQWEIQLAKFADRIAGIDIHALNPQEMTDLLHESGKLYEVARMGFELCHELQFMRVESVIPPKEQLPFAPITDTAVSYINETAQILKTLRDAVV